MEKKILKALIDKGVQIPNPGSVYISEDIDPDRISGKDVIIHSGCKLFGAQTLILDGCRIGHEAPVTLENAALGPNVHLNGGYFKEAVFAGDNSFGSGAHVRECTILEEQANAAHTVGLKQTILFPFVTLGSLINFCDCFMAGGTSRKDHSEVGSSYIHFNYTPNQDKATPSMMGDVPEGVMLRSRPIFLGGQGGLVGPVRINYGCMTAAGAIIRKNELKRDRLLVGGGMRDFSIPRTPFVYKNVSHIYNNNIYYISSLLALRAWYRHVRPLFTTGHLSTRLIQAMQKSLDDAIEERIKRFCVFCDKLIESRKIIGGADKKSGSETADAHQRAIGKRNMASERFYRAMEKVDCANNQAQEFIRSIKSHIQKENYIATIQNLTDQQLETGTGWLVQIQEEIETDLYI